MFEDTQPFLLRESLYSCDGTLILQQGEILSASVLEEIMAKSPYDPVRTIFLKESELFEDFFRVINEDNYRIIFDHEKIKEDILNLLGDISLMPEIVKELELFKLKDFYTYRHILITTAMTVRMVNDLYPDSDNVLLAASTALTHDLGKSRIPIQILQSPDKLQFDEFTYIHEHPWIGFLLLTYYTGQYDSHHAQVSFKHHEKNDGSGYPRGIRVEDNITQLVTINDMFDALISHRPYRLEPYNIRGALDFICEETELGRLNSDGVKLLVSYNRRIKAPIDSITFSQDHLGYQPPDERNNYSGHEDFQEPDLDDLYGTTE